MGIEATTSSGVALDTAIVDEFFLDYGDSALELVQVFIDDTRTRLARMQVLAEARSRDHLALDAHSLKSSAIVFGMTALSTRAARLQRDLDEAWTDRAPSETALLCQSFHDGAVQLQAYIEKRFPH